jgi:ABC-type molybdate transport system substrate-binding protein
MSLLERGRVPIGFIFVSSTYLSPAMTTTTRLVLLVAYAMHRSSVEVS